MVFFGTLVVALVIALFMFAAAFAALVLVGVGRLAWVLAAGTVLGLVHGINHAVGPPGAPRRHRGVSRRSQAATSELTFTGSPPLARAPTRG